MSSFEEKIDEIRTDLRPVSSIYPRVYNNLDDLQADYNMALEALTFALEMLRETEVSVGRNL